MASHVNGAPKNQSQLRVCECTQYVLSLSRLCMYMGVTCVFLCVCLGVCFCVFQCYVVHLPGLGSGQCVLIGLVTDWCIIHHLMESDRWLLLWVHACVSMCLRWRGCVFVLAVLTFLCVPLCALCSLSVRKADTRKKYVCECPIVKKQSTKLKAIKRERVKKCFPSVRNYQCYSSAFTQLLYLCTNLWYVLCQHNEEMLVFLKRQKSDKEWMAGSTKNSHIK